MPRAFTAEERAVIRKKLIEAGIDLFRQLGLRKTAIDDIVRKAGVAKGTFYHFFESKEALYFEAFSVLEDRIQKPILTELAAVKPLTAETLATFFMNGLFIFEQEPLLMRLISGEDMDVLSRRFSPKQLKALVRQDEDALEPLILEWQARGEMVQESVPVITQCVRSFFMLAMHHSDIGEELYTATMRLMAEAIAARLVIET